jgi:hypothetical protein
MPTTIDLDRTGLSKVPAAEVYRHLRALGVPVDAYMTKGEMLGRLAKFLRPEVTKRRLLLDELASLTRIKDVLEARACEIIRLLVAMNTEKHDDVEFIDRAAA